MSEWQSIIDRLRAEFPKHHLSLDIFPSGGMLDAEACEECGSTSEATVLWRYKRNQSFDTAITALKEKLSDDGEGLK